MIPVNIGDKIRINYMKGEPQYTDAEGIVRYIDDIGDIHGSWGGCAIMPDVDEYEVIERVYDVQSKTN